MKEYYIRAMHLNKRGEIIDLKRRVILTPRKMTNKQFREVAEFMINQFTTEPKKGNTVIIDGYENEQLYMQGVIE